MPAPRRSRLLRRMTPWRWLLAIALGLALLDAIYLFVIWPEWEALRKAVPKSNFIREYEAQRAEDQRLPALRWRPVAIGKIAPAMRRAVILGEDSRFYTHEGIDTEAIRDAVEYNWEQGRIVYGASTISQQTVKNLFLGASRDPLRKWHELVLTLAMERELKKRRILEIYLNIAEFGRGLYGVEAAARHYWGVGAAHLTPDQAAALAASLPSPRLHNPQTRTAAFFARKARILRRLAPLTGPAPAPPG